MVGNIAAPCNPTGLAFDRDGDLFIADGARIVTLRPSAASPPTATVYATDVPGANGVAFDRDGKLWVSDGATAQGRVWRIGSDRVPVEMFRVQPMANDVNVDATGVGGVGRDNRGLPPGTITITPTGRQAANTLGSQHLVANGLAFDRDGDLLVADTARGAIWRVDSTTRAASRARPAATHLHVQHTVPRQRARRAPVPGGRRRHRARSRGNIMAPSTSATRSS